MLLLQLATIYLQMYVYSVLAVLTDCHCAKILKMKYGRGVSSILKTTLLLPGTLMVI